MKAGQQRLAARGSWPCVDSRSWKGHWHTLLLCLLQQLLLLHLLQLLLLLQVQQLQLLLLHLL